MINKLVSIIIPVYNSQDFIEKCLDSVVSQTYKFIEIIIVNDGSTDKTSEIINKYIKIYRNIKIITQENKGLSVARNVGVDNSLGEYILFVDSDDELTKNTVQKCVENFTEDVDSVWFKIKVKCEYDDVLKNNMQKWADRIPIDKHYISDEDLRLGLLPTAWSKMFRKKCFTLFDMRFPDGLLNEDLVVHYNYFSIFKNAYGINDILYIYNIRKNSIMDKFRHKTEGVAIHSILILDHIYNFWQKNKLIEHREDLFECIIETYVKMSIRRSNPFEVVQCLWESTKLVRKWKINYKRKFNICLRDGIISYDIGTTTNQVNALKKNNKILKEEKGKLDNYIQIMKKEKEQLDKHIQNMKEDIGKLNKDITSMKKENKKLKNGINILKNSTTYRIGKFFTFIPRKIKELFKS